MLPIDSALDVLVSQGMNDVAAACCWEILFSFSVLAFWLLVFSEIVGENRAGQSLSLSHTIASDILTEQTAPRASDC